MMTPTAKPEPTHPLARAALAASLVAVALALYGCLLAESHLAGSPLNAARNGAGLEFTRDGGAGHAALAVVAYALPFVLGVGAVVAGGEAVKRAERRGGANAGSWQAVFAMMIGGLAAVISGCMVFAVYGWKHVPGVY